MRQTQVRPFFDYRAKRPRTLSFAPGRGDSAFPLLDSNLERFGVRDTVDPDFDRQGGRVSLAPDTGRRLAARRLEV